MPFISLPRHAENDASGHPRSVGTSENGSSAG